LRKGSRNGLTDQIVCRRQCASPNDTPKKAKSGRCKPWPGLQPDAMRLTNSFITAVAPEVDIGRLPIERFVAPRVRHSHTYGCPVYAHCRQQVARFQNGSNQTWVVPVPGCVTRTLAASGVRAESPNRARIPAECHITFNIKKIHLGSLTHPCCGKPKPDSGKCQRN
jgi:hypothetical protein